MQHKTVTCKKRYKKIQILCIYILKQKFRKQKERNFEIISFGGKKKHIVIIFLNIYPQNRNLIFYGNAYAIFE